jgi:UDPglucose 6-dehydrogenase
MNNIVVVGLGYVGLSNALMLAKKNHVKGFDTNVIKLNQLKKGVIPINDGFMQSYLNDNVLNFEVTDSLDHSIKDTDFIIIALPTNFDESIESFDTSLIESTLCEISKLNSEAIIVIKSTVPIGFTESIQQKFSELNIVYSPEFLREGHALQDNLNPSRIVLGGEPTLVSALENLLLDSTQKDNVEVIKTSLKEAEAIKLFSNSYLAMRVAFFNELDSFSKLNNLDTKHIIEGVSLDPRIGQGYNNPSFGYGGYCLPKDSKQLRSNFKNVPQTLISAIVESNKIRKEFILSQVLELKPKVVGVYRLIMKTGSDNFREAAVNEIIEMMIDKDIRVIIYEPEIQATDHFKGEHLTNLDTFLETSDLILANRTDEHLEKFKHKVFSRDIFHNN